jgi:hypothetical protein
MWYEIVVRRHETFRFCKGSEAQTGEQKLRKAYGQGSKLAKARE